MRDIGAYLRAYRAYLASRGWAKAVMLALAWIAGMFAPLAAGTFVPLPTWLAITWMVGWALLGYVFAPYGMWKHHRAQVAASSKPDREQP